MSFCCIAAVKVYFRAIFTYRISFKIWNETSIHKIEECQCTLLNIDFSNLYLLLRDFSKRIAINTSIILAKIFVGFTTYYCWYYAHIMISTFILTSIQICCFKCYSLTHLLVLSTSGTINTYKSEYACCNQVCT